ncbi:MAG: AAA family ATPase [Catenibacterium sp.]|uniref:AAA family ATPase n=1 Tax=Catenibacterium sp. TaxID=2049022 RepID=UPI002F93CD28
METSILDKYNAGLTPSKTNATTAAIRQVNAQHSPLTKIKTGYDRELEQTPIDDYEEMYLLDKENPEETLKDKSYLKDAWTTFMNSRDQINLMSERAKLAKDINPVLDDIDYELNFLSDKQKLKNLENTIPTLDENSEEYKNAISEYFQLQRTLADRQEQYDSILSKYGEKEGDNIDARIEYLSNSRKSWEEERSKVNEEINNIYSDLRERSENYTPSSEFRIKEQRAQDKPWYSPDYFLYAGPGLTGSSMATVDSYIADALATGALWLGRHYATTGALNAVPGIGAASNLIGWGSAIAATAASVAGNIYSRHRESLAQVYGAYRSRIEDNLKEQGIDIKQYAEIGRNQLKQQNPNVDVSKISDDEIIDRVISGEINIDDVTLANAKRSLKNGLERVYDNNMALSAMDVAQSALVFAPLGKAMGKIITAPIKTALNPLLKTGTKLTEAAASKYNKLIDAYTGFNARLAYNSPVKNASLQAAKALGRLGFSATGEAFEEANQDIFDYDYISGKYDKKSSSVFQSLMGLADANYRTAKILSGIDTESELANDPQFWNDVKGGFALGLYMGGPTIAYHSGLKTYKDMTANSFVRDVVADHIGKKDAMIKAMSYSEMANKKLNYQQNVLDVLENYKYNLPEGITEQDLNDEIATANNIFSLSKSKVNQNIGKTIGYNPGTTEYNTLIGLQHLATIDAQEALDNANQAQEADNNFYTTLENDQMLNHYSPEEKLTAVALTKLNIQKQALEQLKTALESKPEENQQKFGITNESNAVGRSISKEIPKILKDIDVKLNQLAEGTKFSPNFVATPNLVGKGVDSYVNTMIANHDLLIAEHKMNEIFGNTLEDGKLINFNNASDESKKQIGKKIKERIDKYINNSDESSKIVEENAKDVVETEAAKEMSREAANQSDNQQPITNNETQVDNQVASKVEQEKVESPKTPIMDDRATPDIDTKIPVAEKEVKEDEEFPTKGLEELSKEFEETLAKVKEKKQEDTERKPKPEPKPVVETQEDEEDEIEFERADEKALIDLANSEAVSDEDDKKVSETYNNSNPEVTEESQVKWARKKIATESTMNRRTDMDSETRDLDESLEIEEMVQDKVSHTLFFNPDATTPIYPGTKPGKELAERIKDPNFFNDSFCEFVINKDYTEKGHKPYKENDPSTYDSASIIMLIHHGTGDYAMALKTPSGARTFLAAKLASIPKERLTEEDINLINNANDLSIADLRRFRNAVISTIESATNDEVVVPSTIVRTKGIPNVVRKDGRAVFRPIHEVKGLEVPTEITDITPEKVTFGISDGIVKDSDIIGANGEKLPGKGGSGQLFIYPPKSNTLSNQMLPLQLTLQRFDRKQAEFLANLLINYGANPNSEYGDTGIIAGELIDFMVRFGDATKVTTADKTFDWLKEKQLYIDDKSNLVIGEKTFNIGNLSTQDKKDIAEALMGFHWRVARKNFFRPVKEALPSIYDYFNHNSIDPLDIIPGVSFTKDDFISSTPVYTMGVLEKAGIIRSDLDDQLFKDSFAYAEDVQKIPRKINNPEVKEAVENKVTNLNYSGYIPVTELFDQGDDYYLTQAQRSEIYELSTRTFKNFPNVVKQVIFGADDIAPRIVFELNGNEGILEYDGKHWNASSWNEEHQAFYDVPLNPDQRKRIVNEIVPKKLQEYLVSEKFKKDRAKDVTDRNSREVAKWYLENFNVSDINEYWINEEKTHSSFVEFLLNHPDIKLSNSTNTEPSSKEESYVKKIINDGEIDPLSLGIDEDFDIPTRKVAGNISEVVTPEEIQWFRNKLGLPEDSLHIVEDAIALGGNEYAMGLVRKDSTILWKGAERGTLYHEAFHRVSLLTISPKERKKIYEFYRNRTGFVGSDKQVEEALAEDFRQYMLNKVDPELNLLKRAWKAIKNFISKWVWRTDTSIDNIFNRIASGYYNRSKQNSAAVNEFLAAYKGAGAPFKVRGHKFKNINNTQFKETVNSLIGALFTLNNVRLRDDLQNLNYGVLKAALKPEITAKLVEKGTITKEQGEVRNEIYNTFDTVFKPEIINKLNEYQIRAVDKQENIDAEIDEKAVGNDVGDQMANYIQEQLAVSVKDNALASIKIFIATMPRTEFVMKQKTNPDGTVTQVQGVAAIKSPVTGLPLMVDFDKSWNTIINEIHSENTFKGMMDKSAKLAKVTPLFKTLYNELYKITNEYVQKKGIQEDEVQKIARENLQTQFRNTFRKARHKLVGILSEKVEDENGNEQTNLYVKDENANKVSKNILEGWNYNLITNSGVLDTSDNLFKAKVSESEEFVAREINNEFNKIIKIVEKYKTTPNKKLVNGQTYKEYVPEKLITIKNKIVDLLNKVGVEIDLESLNSFLTKEYYNSDSTESLVSMLSDRSNKGIYFFFNSKVKDLAKIQESGVVPGQYNRSITKYYDDSKFLGRLAETYAMLHPSSDELSVLSTDGKLLYPISEHNYLSDMVQRLDNDPATVEALTKVLYNTGNNTNPNYFKGSVLLTNLYNNADSKGKIGFETLVYFKEQGSADKGRKYTEISPLEDYIAKMTFTRAGRIILPTMGDSQTYNTLYGTAINNFKNPFDVSNGEIKFDAQILKRFINYFETELDTIEFNYKNEDNLTEEQKVKNYDTGNRNGYRFRYFNGFFKLKERPTLNGIEFEKDFSNFNEALDLAEDLGGNEYGTSIISQIRNNWNKFSNAEKANLMNNYLWDAFKDELDYAQELGIIKWDGNKIASVTSLALPQKALEEASSHYKKSATVSNYSENLGAAEMIGNYFANTISSVIEFEKLFIKDPAYYKNPVDKIKRLREVLSTGVTPRIDYEEGNPMADLTEVNVGTLSDNVIVSRQADQIAEYAKRSAAIRLLQEMHDMTLDEAIRTYDSSEALPDDVEDAANLIVRDKFDGYLNPKGKVNQTDATVLISPEFYKELVRRVDGWTPQVAKAFDLLNDPNADLEADMDTYAEALAVTLKPLKFMYFGDHYDVGAKRDIPVFDKMAMFPVHRIFSTGDMGKVLEVMQSRNIHMLAFDSAVKVGQRAKEVKSRIYKDKTNKEIDMDSLMSMPTHKQSLANFRRQLITDPHHAERQMFVSQAQKAAMGNIRSAWKYTTPDGKVYNGDELINNFNGAHNAITEAGRREIERDFGITPDKPQVSVQRFAEIMQRKALSSNMNDNVINGLDVENGETVAPISGLSDNSWIESGLISMLNKSIVDTNLPGGMFIQMSSILYNRIAVTSDAQNERKLRFANTDGTMDCVISINLLKHIIPDYDKKTFSEAKKWLIDHDIVGPNSKALAMGYRIPAQGQASTAALKVIDLYPEQIGDTITLPDEFTSLTGSDFDIDKLFVARYNYDKNGNRIKFETKEDYTNRLREVGLDDETIVRKVYERYNGKTDFEANSKEANENMLLDMYISVISNPLNFAEARQPLDTVTDYLKDTILKEVDTITGQGKRTSKSQLYYATPAFQSRTKAELNGGKFGIGPFALANAHQVLTQLVKLRFKPNKILRDYGISNLYGIQSNDRNKINILDWLSALINAHVDVAKDPYIIRLNVRKLTFNMTNFLIRSGKGESTFYFLPQQILKDFAIEYDKYSGFYNVDTQNKNPESLAYRTIWNTYFEKAKSLSKGKYDQFLDFLNDKGVGAKQRAKMFDVNYLKKQLKKEETFDWYYNQLLIMKTYQELNPFSRSLSELTTLSQIDTKRFGNNFGLQSAFLDKWKQFMVEQQVFEDPIKVFSNTFLGKKMQDALIFPRIAFQNTMIRLTPEFENLRTLIEFYTKGYAISDDTYINNITRSMEATYKAGFFNKYLAENGIKLSSLLGGPNSISKRLDKIKSDVRSGKYPDLLSSDGSFENVLINNIFSRPKEDTTELNGPDFIAYKPNKSGDNNLENEIIRAWEELWDSDYQEIRDFAKDLALYAFYTSGDAFGKNNIFRYVPNSIREEIGYFDYIRDLERNPDDAVKDIKVFQVIKDLWWNDHVVPTIDYYVLDSSRETIEEEGRPVYRALPHEDSGFTVVNKRGAEVQIPGIIYDKKSQSIISFNQNGQPIFPPFKKVKLDRNNDPRTTFLYEYIGINEDDAPVYRLINKKGMSYRGNILIENGRNRSVLKYNNVVPKDYEIMPEEPITWVTDLTPVKASLRAKAFNQAGEFNTDMLANIQQTVKTQQVTEPLSYQEWVKDYQTQKGEADAEAAYQQYLDNFEYSKSQVLQQPSKQSSIPTNLAETWSQKEGWSTEYFNSKVLPKINEAWQIEYELAPDQSVPAKFKGNMTFDYGEHGRPGLKSKSTIEAVRNGERTATTRYESQGHLDYWKQAQVGDVIEWKRGDEYVKVLVTKPLTKLRTSDATQQDLFASEQSSETINIYAGTGENADLSNFAVRPFTISGDKSESSIRIGGNFQTVEGAFQAQKLVFSSMSDDEKEDIRKQLEIASGSQARSIGRKIKDLNTVSWDKASSDVMRDLLLESFSQNPEALNRLLSTGDVTLTHTQDKGKWGTEFPKILMEVRELLRNRSNIEPAITDTTKEFLDYANQFGFTDEAALLAKDLPKASEEAKKVEEEYVFTFNDGFKINLPFSLNDQQKSALYELEKFIEDYGTEITLSGYAGTGKSTIIGIFSKWLDHRIGRGNIVYTAPTHRANVITKQNNPNANVYTLSALFGFTPDTDIAMEQGSLDLRELEFRSKNQVKYEPGQLIIIDEASMVQDGLYEYIQKIVAKDGVSVIYVGDSAQLRPVKSDHISKVFTSDGVPQITLTKVERTGDNPILKEATRLRRGEGLSYQTDINDKGQGVLYTSDDAIIDKNLKQIVTSEEFNADPLHFRVLTATNAAVSAYNSKIRSLRYGKFAKPFVKGDIIMGYSNKLRKPDGSYKLVNSGDYVIQNITDTTVKFKTDKGDIEFKAFKLSIRPTGSTIMDDFQITVIDKNEPDSKLFEIVEYKDRLWRMAKEAKQDKQISKYRDLVQMAFNIDNELNITKNLEDNQGRLKIRKAIDYGYAQTVWKSQGSTYSKVLILSNEIDTFGYGRDVMQLRNELRYVAVSRAKNFVIINSEAENKKKVSMRNEIAEEDLLDDIEFEPATEEQAIKASLQDSIDELTANGKQRRKECE